MTYHAKISATGKVALPADLRREFGFKPGDTLVFERDGNAVRVKSYDEGIRALQRRFAKYRIPGVSAVDELIARRRAEVEREDTEFAAMFPDRA